jgi:hypothetical protein
MLVANPASSKCDEHLQILENRIFDACHGRRLATAWRGANSF